MLKSSHQGILMAFLLCKKRKNAQKIDNFRLNLVIFPYILYNWGRMFKYSQ